MTCECGQHPKHIDHGVCYWCYQSAHERRRYARAKFRAALMAATAESKAAADAAVGAAAEAAALTDAAADAAAVATALAATDAAIESTLLAAAHTFMLVAKIKTAPAEASATLPVRMRKRKSAE